MMRSFDTRRMRLGPVLMLLFAAGVLWVKPMGLLLWARIRILTNIPRTAIAEPEPQALATVIIDLPPIACAEPPDVPTRDPFALAAE